MRMRALVTILASVALVSACSPGSVLAEGLEGCQVTPEGRVASAAFGLVNTSNEPITLESIDAQEITGATVVDTWFETYDGEGDPEPVLFGGDRRDRQAEGATITELDGTVLERDDAGYVVIAIERTGSAEALLEVVDITTDSQTLSAPVRLLLADSCE